MKRVTQLGPRKKKRKNKTAFPTLRGLKHGCRLAPYTRRHNFTQKQQEVKPSRLARRINPGARGRKGRVRHASLIASSLPLLKEGRPQTFKQVTHVWHSKKKKDKLLYHAARL